VWDDKAIEAFTNLKEVMTHPQAFALPHLNKLFMVEINALRVGMRIVLLQ